MVTETNSEGDNQNLAVASGTEDDKSDVGIEDLCEGLESLTDIYD